MRRVVFDDRARVSTGTRTTDIARWIMNRALLATIRAIVGTSVLMTGGCTPPGENLVAAGKVVVDTQSLGNVRVSRVDV